MAAIQLVNVKTRRSFEWVGPACLVAVSLIFWMAPVQSDPSFHWAFRIVPLALALLLLWHWLGTPAEPTLKEGLRMIQPATDSVCPFCATPLLAETKWQMIVCRVRCPVLSIDVI